jgi:hypothetical protein
MIVLYTTILFVLTVTLFLVKRRVAGLEKKFARVASAAKDVLRQPCYKEGNNNRTDPYETAKKQYLLGLLAQKRDRVEARYAAWQQFAEKFEACVKNFRAWRGKKLPYACGVLDVAGLLALLDFLGASQYANVRALYQLVMGLFTS